MESDKDSSAKRVDDLLRARYRLGLEAQIVPSVEIGMQKQHLSPEQAAEQIHEAYIAYKQAGYDFFISRCVTRFVHPVS